MINFDHATLYGIYNFCNMKMKAKSILLKIFSLATIIGLTVSISGCRFRFKINNKPHIQESVTATEYSENSSTEKSTISSNYDTEKIETTKPNLSFGQSEVDLLWSYGFDESYLRKQYTFDNNNLKSNNNKAYILDRMFNSVDYFTTLQATYTKKFNQKTTLTTYAIDRRIEKAKELVYNVSEIDSKCVPQTYVCVDGDYHLKMFFYDEIKDKNTLKYEAPLATDYKTIKNTTELFQQPLSNKLKAVTEKPSINSFTHDEKNLGKYIDVTKNRFIFNEFNEFYTSIYHSDDISLIYAYEHYHPQQFAMDAMFDFSNWEIETVRTDSNGNDIVFISGEYHDQYANAENSFKLQVDKETGVIISNQIFNGSGNIIKDYNTLNIVIDREIDHDIFDSINP